MKTLLVIVLMLTLRVVCMGQAATGSSSGGPMVLCSPEGISLPRCPEITTRWAIDVREGTQLGWRSDGVVVWRPLSPKRAHAQSPAKATEIPKPASTSPSVSIPVPEPEASQIKAIFEAAEKERNAYVQKVQQLQSQLDVINLRAGMRAKIALEQFDTLVVEPDGKNGLRWVLKKEPKEK